MDNLPICPICGSQTIGALDEWGKTMFHIHCPQCRINVGGPPNYKTIQEFLALANFLKDKHYENNYFFKNTEKIEIISKQKSYFDYSIGMVEVQK